MPVPVKSTSLVYFPVPKVACTSIKWALLNHNEDGLADRNAEAREKGARGIPNVHNIYPSKPLRPTHFIRYFGKRWFCVVRDPVKRFLSAYGNRIVYHDDIKRYIPNLERAGLERHPDLDYFAMHIDEYSRINKRIRHHVRLQTDYLGRKPERFDRVFGMSELDEMKDYIAESGVEIELPHRQTGGPKFKPEDLSPSSMAHIKRYFAEDYAAFGEWFD